MRRTFITIGPLYLMNTVFSLFVFRLGDALKGPVIEDEKNARMAWQKVAERHPEFVQEAIRRGHNHDLSDAVDADESDWR